MELTELIKHPEQLDRETLYELRSMLALYPYFQTARLLLLKNEYLLHDPSFDEDLRRAAIYITDRKTIFQMIEAGHYQLQPTKRENPAAATETATAETRSSRTISLIDNFLESLPKETGDGEKTPKRKPTPADAAVDYVAYLLESESEEERKQAQEAPQLKGQNLIDSFIANDKGKITLNEHPTLTPDVEEPAEGKEGKEGYYTETLARIYIKQGRYSKALEIIHRLSLQYPKKNVYFADQIRFLEKLIINNNNKTV